MKLLFFSDIHNDWNSLERLLEIEADFYISAGDQVSWAKGLDRCGQILQTRGDRVYVLPGNHESGADIAAMCARFGLNDLHGHEFQVGRWRLAGLGYSNPTPFNTPGEYSETELAERLNRLVGPGPRQPSPAAGEADPLVLVCHAPPYGTALDEIRPGLHAGSKSVRQCIEDTQPDYFFCGHIHEAEGVTIQMGNTRAWNVGKKGYLLELD